MPDNTQTLRWGILGTARIASRIAAAIRNAAGAELLAVGSRSSQRAAEWARVHDVERSYGSYQELLDDGDLDAIYIPLPPSMHAEWTIRAAKRGRHVLCEKPLALDVREAEQMQAACRDRGVQLMDGVMWLHHPRARQMQRILSDGTLGRLRRLTSAFTLSDDMVPTGDFRYQRDLGGGSLFDLGWYCVGAAMWAFGSSPSRVYATARSRQDVDVNLTALMWFDDERISCFDCGFDTSMRKWLEVAGTEGSLVCDDFTRPWHPDQPRFWLHGPDGKMSEHVTAAPVQEVAMIENFCDCVRSGRLNAEWPARAVATQRVCDAIAESARKGEVVELP